MYTASSLEPDAGSPHRDEVEWRTEPGLLSYPDAMAQMETSVAANAMRVSLVFMATFFILSEITSG